SPYLPVIELLRDYFGIRSEDDARRRREKVIGKVLGLDRGIEDILPYLFALVGIPDGDNAPAGTDPQIERRPTQDAVKRLLLRESFAHRLIIIFEDLHWIDGESQPLLNLLVDSIAKAQILLLVNYRPEYHHDWGNRVCYSQMRLEPLMGDGADEMLTALLGTSEELTPLKRLLAAKTQGNPFIIEEMVQSLFEQRALTGNG